MRWSFLLVNYNVSSLLEACVASVQDACAGEEVELVVVDNASRPEDAEACRRIAAQHGAQFIGNDTNVGFAAANNQAARMASGDYLVLLNPDTLVFPGLLEAFAEGFRDPQVGAVGVHNFWDKARTVYLPPNVGMMPRALYSRQWARRFPGWGRKLRQEWWRTCLQFWTHVSPFATDLLSGGCMAIRQEALSRIGDLMDERFFLYCEDEDLSLRLRRAGYRLLFHPGTGIAHFLGQSGVGTKTSPHLHASMTALHAKYAPLSSAFCRGISRLLPEGALPLDSTPPQSLGRLAAPPELAWTADEGAWLLVGHDESFFPCAGIPVGEKRYRFPEGWWACVEDGPYWACVVSQDARCVAGPWVWQKVALPEDSARRHKREKDAAKPGEPAWDIGELQPAEEPAFFHLFEAAFGQALEEVHFRWKYRNAPEGSCIFVSRTEGGRLMANYSGVGLPFWWNGRTVRGCQVGDSMSDPEFRGIMGGRSGAFARTALAFFDHYGGADGARFMYGFPSERPHRLGKLLLSYVPGRQVVLLTRLLPPAPVSLLGRVRRLAYSLTLQNELPSEYDSFWERLRTRYLFCVDRTAAHLHWRYTQCPDRSYAFLCLYHRSGNLRGVAVVRVDGENALLLEYLADAADLYAARLLLTHVDEFAVARGAVRVMAWFSPWSREHQLCLERGYHAQPDPGQLFEMGRSFHPDLDIRWAMDNFFYSMGDCDMF